MNLVTRWTHRWRHFAPHSIAGYAHRQQIQLSRGLAEPPGFLEVDAAPSVGSEVDEIHVRSSRSDEYAPTALSATILQGGIDAIDAVAAEWEALCDRSRSELAFLRPAVVRAYVKAFVPSGEIVLLIARRQGEMVAVLPLVERSIGYGALRMRWLESAANVHLPRFDALYGNEDPDEIARVFWKLIRDRLDWVAIRFAVAPLDGVTSRIRDIAASQRLPTGIFNGGESPYIDIPEPISSVDELIARQGSSHRRSLRYRRKRLTKNGELREVLVQETGPDGDISEWLERFCELEHAGWKGESGTSIQSRASTRTFYSILAKDSDTRKHLVCFSLLLDDELVSSSLGLISGATYFGLKMAMNEEYRSSGPGHLLVLYATAAMSKLGCTEIDLGGKADPYKLSWTSNTRPFACLYLFRKGVRGQMLLQALRFIEGPGKRLGKSRVVRSVSRRVRRYVPIEQIVNGMPR